MAANNKPFNEWLPNWKWVREFEWPEISFMTALDYFAPEVCEALRAHVETLRTHNNFLQSAQSTSNKMRCVIVVGIGGVLLWKWRASEHVRFWCAVENQNAPIMREFLRDGVLAAVRRFFLSPQYLATPPKGQRSNAIFSLLSHGDDETAAALIRLLPTKSSLFTDKVTSEMGGAQSLLDMVQRQGARPALSLSVIEFAKVAQRGNNELANLVEPDVLSCALNYGCSLANFSMADEITSREASATAALGFVRMAVIRNQNRAINRLQLPHSLGRGPQTVDVLIQEWLATEEARVDVNVMNRAQQLRIVQLLRTMSHVASEQ